MGDHRFCRPVSARRWRRASSGLRAVRRGHDEVRVIGFACDTRRTGSARVDNPDVDPPNRRTGCILVTGYLGGATATQVRAQDPWFLFPVVLGVSPGSDSTFATHVSGISCRFAGSGSIPEIGLSSFGAFNSQEETRPENTDGREPGELINKPNCRAVPLSIVRRSSRARRTKFRIVSDNPAPEVSRRKRTAGAGLQIALEVDRSLLVGERFTSQVAVLPEMSRQVDTNAERHGRPDPGRSAAVLRIRRAPTAGSAHA